MEKTLKNNEHVQCTQMQHNVIKEISRKMIAQSRLSRYTENFAKLFLFVFCLYTLHHMFMFGHHHFLHIH